MLRYADVLYTQGTADSIRTARTYYSAVVQLTQGEDVRALYGVCATAASVAATPRVRVAGCSCLFIPARGHEGHEKKNRRVLFHFFSPYFVVYDSLLIAASLQLYASLRVHVYHSSGPPGKQWPRCRLPRA